MPEFKKINYKDFIDTNRASFNDIVEAFKLLDDAFNTTEKNIKKRSSEIENSLISIIDKAKETKKKLEKGLEELKELIKGEDSEKIKEKSGQLQKDVQEIGAKMYQKVAEEQAKKQGEEKSKEEPVDAEVVEEEKKE